MAIRQRIEVARVGEYWMRVYADTDTVTQERVLPGDLPLVDLNPEFVKKIGSYIVWSIDEPSADERRCAFETGMMILVEITNSGMLARVNTMAQQYAAKNALERWPWPEISETMRDRMREIIANSYENNSTIEDIVRDIQDLCPISEARAELIARTETSQAQVGANWEAWKKSGVVSKVKWLSVGPDPCPVCLKNNGVVRIFWQKFPSGDVMPLAHAGCNCILAAVFD